MSKENENNEQNDHDESSSSDANHQNHHKMMIKDFRIRFIISVIITIPILVLSPLIQSFLGYDLSFTGRGYLLFGIATFIFFYGGFPFLKGLINELKEKSPGMMTLIALAITVAYVYSGAVVFGLEGRYFFWELATLIDVMLLGHWIEMRSVVSASSALDELAKLMPDKAHLKTDDGMKDVNTNELGQDDVFIVKPSEKIPADGIIVKGDSAINESMLTGESKPVNKGKDDEVIGGFI